MTTKKIVFALGFGLLCAFSLQAQRTAYMYGDTVLKSIPAYGIRVAKLDSTRQVYLKEINAEQGALQQKLNKLSALYSPKAGETIDALKKRMTPSDTLTLNLLINNGKQIDEQKQAYDKIVQASFDKEVQPLLDNIRNVVARYARENKISMVVQYEQLKGALIYLDPKEDITKPIIALLAKKK